MNIFTLLVGFFGFTDCSRLGHKGNMRGVTVDFSSMPPRQAAIIKHLIKQNCIKKYGRFSSKFC